MRTSTPTMPRMMKKDRAIDESRDRHLVHSLDELADLYPSLQIAHSCRERTEHERRDARKAAHRSFAVLATSAVEAAEAMRRQDTAEVGRGGVVRAPPADNSLDGGPLHAREVTY